MLYSPHALYRDARLYMHNNIIYTNKLIRTHHCHSHYLHFDLVRCARGDIRSRGQINVHMYYTGTFINSTLRIKTHDSESRGQE